MKTLKTKEARWSSGRCKNCALCSSKKRTNSNPKLPKKKPLANTKQIAAMFALFLLLSVFGSVNIYAHDTGTEHIDCQKLYLPAVIGGSTQQAQAADAAEESTQATLPCGDDAIEDAGRETRIDSTVPSQSAQNEQTANLTTVEPRHEDYGIQRLPLSWDITNTEPFWIGVPEGCLDSNHELFNADLGCNDTPNWGGPNGDIQLFDPVPRPHIYYWSEHQAPNGQIYEKASKAWNACRMAKGNPGNFDCVDYGVQRLPYPDQNSTEPFWIGMPFGCRLPAESGYNPDFVCHDESNPVVLNGTTYFDPVERPDSTANDFYYFSRRLVGDALIVEDHSCAPLQTTNSGLAFKNSAHADCYYRAAYRAFEQAVEASLTVNGEYATELTGEAIELTIARNDASTNATYQLNFSGPAESNRTAATIGEDFDLFETVADISNNTPLNSNQVTLAAGELSKTVYFHAYSDELVEVPEVARIQLFPSGATSGAPLDTAEVIVRDDEPGFTSDSMIFLANLTPLSANCASSNASGYATVRLSNDNSYASVSLHFQALGSIQIAPNTDINFTTGTNYDSNQSAFGFPAGQIEGEQWDIEGFLNWSNQDILDALLNNQLYVNVLTMFCAAPYPNQDPAPEISGILAELTGSVNFTPPSDPDPIQQLTGNDLKRDIARFLTQATFGPTPDLVDALYTLIMDPNGANGDRMRGYSAWIDAQFDLESPSMLDVSNAMYKSHGENIRPEAYGLQRILAPIDQSVVDALQNTFPNIAIDLMNDEAVWLGVPEGCVSGADVPPELECHASETGAPPYSPFNISDFPLPELYTDVPRIVNGVQYATADEAYTAYNNDMNSATLEDYDIQILNGTAYWIGIPGVCQTPDHQDFIPPARLGITGAEAQTLCSNRVSIQNQIYSRSPRLAGTAYILRDSSTCSTQADERCCSTNGTGLPPTVDLEGETVYYFENASQAACYQITAHNYTFGSPYGRALGNDVSWLTSSVYGKAHLRERIAFALSEILVVSMQNATLSADASAVASYYDLLKSGAFDPYEDLLYDVSIHPAMGHYLSMFQNEKASAVAFPDENYAREIMQLFSIGLLEMHPDGSLKLDSETGLPLRTYTQNDITNLAKVFTGWSYSVKHDLSLDVPNPNNPMGFVDASNFYYLSNIRRCCWPYALHLTTPMTFFEEKHDTGSKTLWLGGTESIFNDSAENEMQFVTSLLATHDNTGPFLARRLIQRLVTSNPSRRYVFDVATAYSQGYTDAYGGQSYGSGELAGVIKAILLHPESRNLSGWNNDELAWEPNEGIWSDSYGKTKEYLVQYVSAMRLVRPKAEGKYERGVDYLLNHGLPSNQPGLYDDDAYLIYDGYYQLLSRIDQAPLRAPSVFGWFSPDYVPSGEMAKRGVLAPELQHVSENTVIGFYNKMYRFLLDQSDEPLARAVGNVPSTGVANTTLIYDMPDELILNDTSAIFNAIDLYLCAEQLKDPNFEGNSAFDIILTAEQANANSGANTPSLETRIRDLLYLAVTSPQCRIQR